MKTVRTKKISMLIWSIFSSVCLVAGVPLIVIGALNNLAVMIIGLVLVVVNFYAVPFLWIGFGNVAGYYRLVQSVELDNLYTTKEIASAINKPVDKTAEQIRLAIQKRYLVGYKFIENERLVLNENEKLIADGYKVYKCSSCGGSTAIKNGEVKKCSYCGSKIE